MFIAACAKRALPEEKVRGFAKFALTNGSAISQSGSDDYSPNVIQMGDNSLVLIFGSNRSCGGCSGHNLFIAKSATAYNNNSVFPAFSAPTVLTITATPLNYANRINFAATAAGNNVRIYLTNAGGTIQVTPNIPADGPYDTTLTTIANTAGQTGSVVGIEFTGSKLYARLSGAVNSFDPANAAGALTAMATGNSATAIGCVDGAITSRYDGFFSLVNGSVIGMSLYGDGGSLSAVNTAIAKASITPRSLTLMQGGGTTGPLMFISGTETGGTSEDLYVVDGLTVWQMWQQLEPKPPGAPAGSGGGGGAPDTTGPAVTNVTATAVNGSYNAGASITIQIVFSEPVIATVGGGGVYLALNSGGTGVYNTGSGTNTLDIKYTVIATQNAADLNYSTTAALTLVGGATIKDSAGNNAVLTLPALAAAGSLGTNKNIVIDTGTPVISAVSPASSSSPSTTQVSYTLSETVASGSITWTRTGGTADGGGSPPGTHTQALTGTELNSGAHTNITLTNNPALVSGTVYSVAFNATDAAGNSATTVTNTNVTYSPAVSGTTWTARTLPTTANWSSVAFGGSTFVAVAYNSSIGATSPDGLTWTQRVLPAYDWWLAVAYGNSTFVATTDTSGTQVAGRSADGITWASSTMPTGKWQALTFGSGLFVALSANTSSAATSPDGITWTTRTLPVSANWTSVTFGSGTFVAVASGSNIALTSPDGINWTQRSMPASATWNSVAYGNAVFMAVSGGTAGATSPDGTTWTARTLPSATWNAVAFGNGAFVAVGGGGGPTYAANSADGSAWTARTISGGANWRALTYGTGLFAALNYASTAAATSP